MAVLTYMKTPKWVPGKSVLNVINDDNECFKWAVLAAVFPTTEHANRVTKYKPFHDKFNFNGIRYPPDLSSSYRSNTP